MDSTTRLRHRQVQVSYAWVIVGASFLTLMTTGGTRFGFGLFFKPIEESLGWDKTTLSIAVSINMIIYGVTLPMVGYLTDRHGPKRVILASLLLAGLGMMLLSQTRALWQLYLFYGVLVGIGTGGSAFVPISALIARWFVQRRSLGMGVAFAGASAGQLVMIPLTLLLLTTTNWHVAFLVLGLGLVVVVAPAVLILVRETPGTTAAAAESARSAFQAAPSLSVRQALRTRTFWLLAGGFSTCGFSVTTISIHLPSYVDDLGLSQGVAAAALTVMGALSLTGSILAGLLSTRFDRKTLLAGVYFLRGASLVMLVLAANPAYLWIFAPLVGLSWIATVPLVSALAAASFGPAAMATILGLITMSHRAGDAVGVFLSGYLRDMTGSYEVAFLLVAATLFVASMASYLIEEPRLKTVETAEVATT